MAAAPTAGTPDGRDGAKGVQALGWSRNARMGAAAFVSQVDGARYNTLQKLPLRFFYGDVEAPYFPFNIPQTPDQTARAASPVPPTWRK
jgi:hypothetical protein